MDSKQVPDVNVIVKKTRGLEKIEMKKMSNDQSLQATFSKRRTGIFKKARDLATFSGVELAVIVFSPNNKVISFGSLNVGSVIQHYTRQVSPTLLNPDRNEAHLTVDERELQAHLAYLYIKISPEKNHTKEHDHLLKATENKSWWAPPLEKMNKAELVKFKAMLEKLETHVNEKCEKLLSESTFTHNPPQSFAGGSSYSNVNSPMAMRSTPLMENHVGEIDWSVMRHRHFHNKPIHGDEPTFGFF